VFLSKWKPYYDSYYTRKLTWRSFISGPGPYARANARLLWALDRARVHVNLGFLEGAERAELADFRVNDMKNRPAERDRPQVVFGPPEMLRQADGSYNIGYVFSPYDRFDEQAAGAMNSMREVWVTSEAQREAAVASGVKKDVFVIHQGVDPDYFHPGITGFPLAERFTFVAPIEWGTGAASETLLRAFTDEFEAGEKVVLVMKITSPSAGAEVEEAVERMALPAGRAPAIFVMDHEIPAYQLGSLFRSADCVVLPMRKRGLEPLAAEALACAVPVIATAWYLEGEALGGTPALPVEYTLVPSPAAGSSWAEPDYSSLRAAMRRAVAGIDRFKEEARETSASLVTELDWDAVAARIIERLDAIT
jgi:glycosyltransferase involved in cell wall biosynthesis